MYVEHISTRDLKVKFWVTVELDMLNDSDIIVLENFSVPFPDYLFIVWQFLLGNW